MSAWLLYRLGRRCRIHGGRNRFQGGIDAPRSALRFRIRIGHGGSLRPGGGSRGDQPAGGYGTALGKHEIGPGHVGELLTVGWRRENRKRTLQRRAAYIRGSRLDLGMHGVVEPLCEGRHVGLAASRRPGLLAAVEHEDAAVPDSSPGLVAVATGDPADLIAAADVQPHLARAVPAQEAEPDIEAVADRLERLTVDPYIRHLPECRECRMRG